MNTIFHSNVITPNHLDVLVHYYTTPGDHPHVASQAVLEAIADLEEEEILRRDSQGDIHVSEKGCAWLKLMLNTPYPIQKRVDPRTEGNGAR